MLGGVQSRLRELTRKLRERAPKGVADRPAAAPLRDTAAPLDPQLVAVAEKLCQLVPGFAARWAQRDDWLNPGTELCGVFIEAQRAFSERLPISSAEERREVFDFIEACVSSSDTLGGSGLADAAAVCFLEDLVNVWSNRPEVELIVPFLGPASAAFCRSYDKFTGVKTPGLWPAA